MISAIIRYPSPFQNKDYIDILHNTYYTYYNLNLNIYNNYLDIKFDVNLTIYNKIKKIKIAIYCLSMKKGGTERLTALLLNYFDKVKIFDMFLITTTKKEEDEYIIPKRVERVYIDQKKKCFN